MKTFILFVLSSTLLFSCASYYPIAKENQTFIFIDKHNLSKDDAFETAYDWVATNFNSANDVIQLKDKERGKIIIHAIGAYFYDPLATQQLHYRYTLIIRVKDKKIKYEFIIGNDVETNSMMLNSGLSYAKEEFRTIRMSLNNALNNYNNDDEF